MQNVQQKHEFECQVRKHLQYLLYLPKDYDPAKHWPLVLFLHGAGERGNNLDKVRSYGIPKQIDEGQEFPFIVVSPQCPRNQWWDADVLSQLLDKVESTYVVDADRIYVTGLSMGGFGTWDLAIRQPQRFAAIAPICGGGDEQQVHKIKHLPVWVFHGAKDNIVKLQESEKMVKALEACGGHVQFTVYPDAGHDSWTETYANPQLYSWLLEHSRATRTR